MLAIQALPEKGINPREFCRIWFKIAHLSPEEIAEYETESGYRKQCVQLLSNVLGVAQCSVRRWGSGLNFSGIPEHHTLALAYALQAAGIESTRKNKAA